LEKETDRKKDARRHAPARMRRYLRSVVVVVVLADEASARSRGAWRQRAPRFVKRRSALVLVLRAALPGLEAWVRLADDVGTTAPCHHLAIAVTLLCFFE
jgi:hypothetical protein